ncbi:MULTISPECIES: response regulator [Sphingobacterium]|uniref:Response regulator transcription factor n=1 Tax=Sphingobacterium kitahiroshimense TaxID=470446 RepID=A0ABV0BSQ0_9SPHI|nr:MULTISPECIES: response regulator transcription factor [Sphingobacterium]MBB2950035.1 DNA-binding NarL/FixJ family response regulator [Sphingobacterium sp. JUb56]MCS3554659.1 DNA-binding NarL/FixJ family response regulator [Sphingobacterium sp. JUb21]MCW2263919.1 DNA-binding NarL/FixJ family response regulator [Sphingobacterium kitahiroshimense]QQD14043.1 response regulator transcription factor [Sphingobacterium sp. UDSM-2020]TCR01669.1 LuxR family two component transcriptional regulator [Sp
MIKIAITDDHPLLSEGLKNILSKEDMLEVVGCYPDASTMHKALSDGPVDVLLLDINLPDANSIELIKPLRSKYPQMRIIVISVHNEYAVINSVLQEGAQGYIQKNASVEEIVAGVEQVIKGNKFLCSQTKNIVERKSKDELKSVPKLTRREKEVLTEASLGLTTGQIAEKLFISPHTVESHRKNLIEKFDAKNLSSAIKLALEYGLIRQ